LFSSLTLPLGYKAAGSFPAVSRQVWMRSMQ
jgi:hypothetical protein